MNFRLSARVQLDVADPAVVLEIRGHQTGSETKVYTNVVGQEEY